MAQDPSLPDTDEKLGDAIAAYLRLAEAGHPPDRTEFLARYPDLGAELESFFANDDDVDRLTQPLRDLAHSGSDSWQGRTLGDYEILGEVGRGGMGVVYRANHRGLGRTVALKMIRAGRLATREDVERFRIEAKAAASLNHPHIVPIYDFEEHDGHQFFTMQLVQGRTLDRHDCDFSSDPREAARLLALVARAVHHAHQRRIIHRDLKPANILIDDAGEPHITDFGLAAHAEGGERPETADIDSPLDEGILGTIPYIAPERLSGKVQPVTTSVDIWSLGVILYELLTGEQPFRGKSEFQTLDKILKQAPAPPRTLNRRISRDLEAICLKSLEKEPERRYGSALGLARDLERWLQREPIEARPVHRVVRAWSWCRRNPAGAGLIMGACVVLAGVAMALMLRIAEKKAADEEKLKGLVHTARLASNVILNRMQEWGTRVEAVAHSPELQRLLSEWNRSAKERPSKDPEDLKSRPEARNLQAFLERLPQESKVVNWQIMDALGVMMARKPAAILGVNFTERDYFIGTLGPEYFKGTPGPHVGRVGPGAVHVSSVYHSQADGLDKFDICSPILDAGNVLGVLAVSVTTDPTLGIPHMHEEQRKVVLVAPWDPSPPNDRRREGAVPEFVILLHPAMTPAHAAPAFDKRMFPCRFPRSCDMEFATTDTLPVSALARRDYVDPFGSADARGGKSWFAGFAPVGNTGFVVIVQQREE